MKKILAIALAAMMTLALVACGCSKSAKNDAKPTNGTASSATSSKTDGAPLSDAEAWYGTRTYTIQEYLNEAPRIMIICEPRFIGKNYGVSEIYIINNGMVTEKRTVPSSNVKTPGEMQQFSGQDWEQYIAGLKKITLGELAQMSEDELWSYVDLLETVSETPLSLHSFTDRTGNNFIGEDISDLLHFGNYMGDRQMNYMNFPIYSKYYIGYSIVSPAERNGYFFLSDEDVMLVFDDWNSSGVEID